MPLCVSKTLYNLGNRLKTFSFPKSEKQINVYTYIKSATLSSILLFCLGGMM